MQRTRRHRKLLLGGFPAGVALLAAASVGYACVQTIGRLEVTGSNGGSSVAVGNGLHPGSGDNYCVPPTNGATAERSTSFANRPLVTVSYGPASQCDPIGPEGLRPGRPNKPVAGTYEVMYCDGQVFRQIRGAWVNVTDPHRGSCFFTDSPADRAVQMGFMTVSPATVDGVAQPWGSGSGTFRIPAFAAKNQPNNAAGVSVRRSCCGPNPYGGPPDVNMAPISII